MEDGLASRFAIVQANVEAIGIQIILEPLPSLGDQCPEGGLGVGGEFVDAGDMLLDIENRIGQIAEEEEQERPQRGATRRTTSLKPPKHERLG